ncbi:M60 family metallopeptidase [Streptomyces sp. NPDC050658]|uniref:M60 family metallopeptidase n=1 Tax=unclassified Streptomyces TaxID=2593676 RepID=UPI00341F8612
MRSTPLHRRTVLTGIAAATGALLLPSAPPALAAARPRPKPRAAVTVNLTARVSAESQRLRLGAAQRASDFFTTAAYAPAGTAVTVTVSAPDGVLPTLHVGIPDYYATPNAPRSYALKSGTNTVTDPYGGPLHLTMTGSGQRATVTIGAGSVPMPTFTHGSTTEAAFQAQLDSATAAGYVQLRSAHAIVTLSRATALQYRAENHASLLDTYEQLLTSHAAFSGLSGGTGTHARNPLPYHFVNVTKVASGVGAYATHGYTGYPSGAMTYIAGVNGLRTGGWGMYHELGHQHQQFGYKPGALTEVTCNLYSLAAQRTLGQTSRLLTKDANGKDVYDRAFTARDSGTDYATLDVWQKLVPLWQLRLAFGSSVWPELHKLIRTDNPTSATDADRYDNLAVYASRATGRDLSEFFVTKWRFPVTANGKARIAALGLSKPTVDASTYRE